MSTTKKQEFIYNTYLITSRTSHNKPFKLRQDFSKFNETEYYTYTTKLERIFNQHPEIDIQLFFKAPFALHPGESFDLKFFTTLRAVKCYSLYIKALQSLPCDNIYHLQFLKQSLKFIKNYCTNTKIPVAKYSIHSSNGVHPDWLIHIKNRYIDPFIMFGFTNIRSIIEKIDRDIIDILIPDFYTDFYSNILKFNNSSKAKLLINKGLEIIQKSNK
jgi:hypothetical protein